MTILWFVLGFVVGGMMVAWSSKEWLRDLRETNDVNDRLEKEVFDLRLENTLWECAVRTRDANARRVNEAFLRTSAPKHPERN